MKWLIAGLLMLSAANTALAETSLSADVAVGVYSKYLWRGYDLGGDADYLVQPEVTFGLAGVSLGVWGNYNEATEKLDEVDVSFEYAHDFGELISARLGHISYAVKDGADTAEVYVGASLALPVDIALDLNYDYDEAEAWFASLGLSKGFRLSEQLGLNASVAFGCQDFDYLNQGEVGAGLDYSVLERLTFSPAVLYSFPLSRNAEDAGVEDAFVASLTVAYSF